MAQINKLAVAIVDGPGYNMACQAATLLGSAGGETFTGVTYTDYVTVGVSGPIFIASKDPVILKQGMDPGAQVIASWFDPFGRNRRITGYEGQTITIRSTTTSTVYIWGSTTTPVPGNDPP